MIPFLLGAAVGYVLGARAGRERYEQLARTYRRLADHPAVQGAAGIAKAKMVDAVSAAAGARREPLASTNGRGGAAS
ncbi:hypothetical protein [Pseudonocardia acaciae]|uniref:hypothetical protein n=1 Tax=Pseudonocardia acaciae TaxID=551276 RepID=UPI0005610A26|nr:hypothetical protein [Pseudonocardia acaciae]